MSKGKRSVLKKFLDVVTVFFVGIMYLVSRIVPMNVVSILLGILGVILCPFIRETYLADKNIKKAFPEKSVFERIKIVCGVWFNLGLFAGEYCYVYRLTKKQLEKKVNFVDKGVLENIINNHKNKIGTLIISGHFSNWELAMSHILRVIDAKINVVYRESNNQFLERIVIQQFKKKTNINLIAKNNNAGIRMVRALKNGEIVVLLSDQSDRRNGILIDFFNRKAYTNTTPFSLYKKLDIDLYFMYFIRQRNFFKIDIFCEKLKFDREKIEKVKFLTVLNEKFEKSITKKPSQWFWVHNRWKG
ncbi:MAG: hypothetical protein LBG48_00570 [Rickettsiales bacterium]|jgi:KDO2-lipid IV(A) lauroyltransferase|nr:hypothetical protein [Rickettsiales bacterium]